MRILYVLKEPFGSMGTAASYMIPSIVNEIGNEVLVLSPELSVTNKLSIVFQDDNLDFVFFQKNNSKIKKALYVKEIINDFQPDIVHVFYHRWAFLLPTLSKNFNNNAKWVLDIRSPHLTKGIKRVLGRMIGPIEQFGYDVITTPSTHSAKNVISILLKKCFNLPIGVDKKIFSHQEKKNADEKKSAYEKIKFIYIGSISKSRKINLLVESFAVTKKCLGPQKEFVVDFFGNGDAIDDLKKMVINLKLSETVKFHNAVPQNQLSNIMSEYDIGIGYIHHQLYNFSPGLKVLEYMASSLGVIASDTPGNKLFIKDRHNGILMGNTPFAISESIIEVIKNGYPEQYIREAYKIVDEYDWKSIVKKKLMPLYQKLIN